MNLQVVEVCEEFQVHGYRGSPGARVMAWQQRDGTWVVYFNGIHVLVADGRVAALGTGAPKKEAAQIYSAARLEQDQVAPAESA